MNDAMGALGRELALMAEDGATRALSEIAVLGLDGPAPRGSSLNEHDLTDILYCRSSEASIT